MFMLLDKLGITVEKVACHLSPFFWWSTLSWDRSRAQFKVGQEHLALFWSGTWTLNIALKNLLGFCQVERSWDAFQFKWCFFQLFVGIHQPISASPISRSHLFGGTGGTRWPRSSPCAPCGAGWRWCRWRRLRPRRRWRRGRSWRRRISKWGFQWG